MHKTFFAIAVKLRLENDKFQVLFEAGAGKICKVYSSCDPARAGIIPENISRRRGHGKGFYAGPGNVE
jgi:hypothetical protein